MSQQSPFKFLNAYHRDDVGIFFGRKEETEILYEKVVSSNLTLLYGASGTGKTSLVSCGLSNRFDEADWHEIFIRRGNNVVESFWSEILHRSRKTIETPTLAESIEEMDLDTYSQQIQNSLQSLYLDYYVPIYLIFDQFEELFVLGKEEEQVHFFHILKVILESSLPVKVLLVLREEYLAHMSVHEKILPYLLDNRFRLERMNQLHLKEVISGTTQAYKIEIETEEETIERIITSLRDKKEGVDLTYLQVYLDRLYRTADEERKSETGNIKFNLPLVEKVGELEDILEAFLGDQIRQVERELEEEVGGEKEGIPLLILYALVSNEFTKRALDIPTIMQNLPKDPHITEKEINFCIERFMERRILKQVEED